MDKIYNWLARRFNPRVEELERELQYVHKQIDDLSGTIKSLNDKVYHINGEMMAKIKKIDYLEKLLRQNT